MIAPNHLRWAAGCWIITAGLFKIPLTPIDLGVATISGLAPDLDTPKSSIGKRFPFIAYPLGFLVGHRGFTHSLIAIFICLAGLTWLLQHPQLVGWQHFVIIPFLIGYLSHLLGDMMNPSGIPLLWPHQQRYRFPFHWSYKSPVEYVFTWSFLLFALYIWWIAGGYPLSKDTLLKLENLFF
ncbi:MAG: metal-dependent hydrolase [Alphaproteobacteria bacterium]|nr:metal-dependent hydrolase [Alphaproteobacteria bacterium]